MLLDSSKQFYGSPLESRAIELLRHVENYPGLPAWQNHEVLLRLVHKPSFQPYTVWALGHKDGVYAVRRVQWNRPADHHPLNIAPTTYGADAQLPPDQAESLLTTLSSITLPPFIPVSTFGIDGESYEISFGEYGISACLSWRCEPPQEWQQVADWYTVAVLLFESVLPASTAYSAFL